LDRSNQSKGILLAAQKQKGIARAREALYALWNTTRDRCTVPANHAVFGINLKPVPTPLLFDGIYYSEGVTRRDKGKRRGRRGSLPEDRLCMWPLGSHATRVVRSSGLSQEAIRIPSAIRVAAWRWAGSGLGLVWGCLL